MPLDRKSLSSREALVEGLNQLDQGISIFDGDLKLVAWNDLFLRLQDYPKELAFAGADFASFAQFDALRKGCDVDEARRLVLEEVEAAKKSEIRTFEWTRPDGVAIGVRRAPLSGGGVATTCAELASARRNGAPTPVPIDPRILDGADELPVGLAFLDADLRFRYASRRFTRIHMQTTENIIGERADQVLDSLPRRFASRQLDGRPEVAALDFELNVASSGSRARNIRILSQPHLSEAGEVAGLVWVSIDETYRRAAEASLAVDRKMDALGRMASSVSHSFNNLLTVILGNLAPLSDRLHDRDLIEEFVTPSISAARRGANLTQRMLAVARRDQSDPERTDVDRAIAAACRSLRDHLPNHIELVHLESGEALFSLIDKFRLESALSDLVRNSRDAIRGRGRITIESGGCELRPPDSDSWRLKPGSYVKIKVSDSGEGMSSQQIEQMFEPFFSSRPTGSGFGLGLSLVYSFVQQSKGGISVESDPGIGTTFTILLPGDPFKRQWQSAANAPTELDQALSGVARAVATPIVLLVQSDRNERRKLRLKINRLGYPLMEAEEAEEALGLLRDVDGVFLALFDFDLTGAMNGVDFAREVSASSPHVRLTMMLDEDRYDQGLALTGVRMDLLRKPFGADQLAASIEASLDRWRGAPTGGDGDG